MSISSELREQIRRIAKNRCGYCLSHQRLILGWLEFEHIVPKAKGGADDESNLWLACRLCNSYKGSQTVGFDPESDGAVTLFNPRSDRWKDHFRWSDDGLFIVGQTPAKRIRIRRPSDGVALSQMKRMNSAS